MLVGASLSEPHTDKFRFCRVYIYIYIYAPYVRLTVNFLLLHGQDGRPLRSPLRATQILATDSFKREGNRTKRCEHYKLSPRQGYRHGKLKYRQLIFLHVREFHRTLSEVVSRSLLYTMPTGTPLRRTLSNTTASENLLPPLSFCLLAAWDPLPLWYTERLPPSLLRSCNNPTAEPFSGRDAS